METLGGWIAAAAVGIALAGIAVYVLVPARRRVPSARLFLRFAEASHLTPGEAKVLRRMADRVQPDTPGMMFVRRTLFEAAAAEERLDSMIASELRRKLYGP